MAGEYGCVRCGDTCVQGGICQVCGASNPVEPFVPVPAREHPTQPGYDWDDPKAWRLERLHNEGVW